MLRNMLMLASIIGILSGCLPDLAAISTDPPPSKPVIDVNTGKVLNMWIPKEMRRVETWKYIARAEERMCSDGDYLGKHIDELSSFQRSIYKKYNDDVDKIWAYYYYYDSPAAPSRMDSVTVKRMTVFNLYPDRNGKIYGCTWARYSGGYHRDHGTDDWLTP